MCKILFITSKFEFKTEYNVFRFYFPPKNKVDIPELSLLIHYYYWVISYYRITEISKVSQILRILL